MTALDLALEETPPSAERRATVMANLAAALRDRYRALNGPDDLDRAAALLGAVLQDDPDHGIDRPRRVLALAGVLADRYQDRGSELDRAEANEAYQQGCAAGRDLDPDSALGSADEWGRWADAGVGGRRHRKPTRKRSQLC